MQDPITKPCDLLQCMAATCAQRDRLKDLCHDYYMAYSHGDAVENECEDLWLQGAARHGELRIANEQQQQPGDGREE